jgi:hypothetical protein
MPAMSGFASGSNVAQMPSDRGRNHQRCQDDGGISVRPCRVTFDADHSGPTDVLLIHGGDGDRNGDRHRIEERDNCASRRTYTVTAGSIAGSCTANFSDNGNRNDGGGNGSAASNKATC